MSVVDSSLVGLTLDDVLGNAKKSEPPPSQNNTFLDTIRDDASTKDKKSWKVFRDKLRLKRAGSAWISSIPIPESDVNVQGNRSRSLRRISLDDSNHIDDGGKRASAGNSRMQLARRSSVRFAQNSSQTDHHDLVDATMPSDGPPSSSFKPQDANHHAVGNDSDDDGNSPVAAIPAAPLAEGRAMSAREAVASQEAAEAAAAAAIVTEQATMENNALPKAEEPVQMSLMDLLGESGSSYTMGEDDDECYDEEEEEEEEIVQAKGTEFTCCVCKVKLTSSTFMPCGHIFCRLCSKELSVQRGNCALCDGFVLEILEIF